MVLTGKKLKVSDERRPGFTHSTTKSRTDMLSGVVLKHLSFFLSFCFFLVITMTFQLPYSIKIFYVFSLAELWN
jgi:hypothetical protein